jgi:hypothetical protein
MKFILIGLVALVGLAYGGAKAYIHYQVSDSIDAAVLMLAPYGELEYGGVSSTLTGELTLDDVRIKMNEYNDGVYIGCLGINTPSFLDLLKLSDLSSLGQGGSGGAPEYFGILAEDIRIPVAADYYQDSYAQNIAALAPADIRQGGVQCVGKYGHSPRALAALGYQELVISMSVLLQQGDSSFTTRVDFDIVDMMAVEMEVEMDGNALAGAVTGAIQPTLHQLRMKITDHSLNQRVYDYCSRLGLTPAQIERAHLNALQYFGSTVGIKFDSFIIDPYKEFLDGKSSFIMTAIPRQPLPLSKISMYKPSDVPALLNLEAVAQ